MRTTIQTIARSGLLLVSATLVVAPVGCSSSAPARPRSTTTADATPTPLSRPGPADYGTVSRELAAIENASIDNVYLATQEAIRGLELRLVEKTKDGLSATVAARTAHDDRVMIALSRVSSGVTDVKIKVGFWGDEDQSRAILTEIRRRLSTSVSQPLDPALLSEPGVLAAGPKPVSPTLPPPTKTAAGPTVIAPAPASTPAASKPAATKPAEAAPQSGLQSPTKIPPKTAANLPASKPKH